jgi:rare lipoprotein A (peptidoglycan hydrolase)
MVQPNQLVDVSLKAAHRTVRRTQETFRDIPSAPVVRHVVSTAHIIISAEERLRQRVRAALRVAVATAFLAISGLISLGANVTMAFAKKVSPVTRTRVSDHRSVRERCASQLHGVASWYGKQFNHRRTASGIRFNTNAMMAAHRTLPFGTRVRVTNLTNKRSCVVEITDRGPYAHGRVIDLSYAAASRIGMDRTGTAKVKIEVLSGFDGLPDIADQSDSDTPDSLATPQPIRDAILITPPMTSDRPVALVSADLAPAQ